jgi:hypothetical protein
MLFIPRLKIEKYLQIELSGRRGAQPHPRSRLKAEGEARYVPIAGWRDPSMKHNSRAAH